VTKLVVARTSLPPSRPHMEAARWGMEDIVHPPPGGVLLSTNRAYDLLAHILRWGATAKRVPTAWWGATAGGRAP
jgi:hypothetical protein